MIHGVINVYKEKGYTSHDVVAKLRRILQQKKIGHTGTLDPEAEGVLPVCLGAATRLCDMLTEKEKEYRAVLLLGTVTDTQDTQGKVLSVCSHVPQEEEVRKAICSFEGEYQQIPPMYSALKVNGKKLYELAREGKTVERKARAVRIHHILIEEMNLPRVCMTVSCSKGTYIRTLCHDIGQRLGCGAAMEALVRTQAAGYRIEDAISLGGLQSLKDEGNLTAAVHPVDEVFAVYPALQVRGEAGRLLKNGNPLGEQQFLCVSQEHFASPVRVYDAAGKFAAVYRYRKEKGAFCPVKMFSED